VQNGEDDVYLGERLDAVRRLDRQIGTAPKLGLRVRSRKLPGAVTPDLDRAYLVTRRIERLDDRTGRGPRDLVLARAPALDDRYAETGDGLAPRG
jgi:hypothetical protein